jgi:thymidylate synthase (FAD)
MILDKGYVRKVDQLGNDLSVVNAARVSYDKESNEFDSNDERLLKFLLREKHYSPLRHCAVTLEVYAPLIVARQWWKYAVGSAHTDDQLGWNESSRRYITEKEEFYLPPADSWRTKPENSKQGSGDPLPLAEGQKWTDFLQRHYLHGHTLYEIALQEGVAPEQARLFLPAYGLYVRWRWTASLQSTLHFLEERLDSHAQYEIQQYAKEIEKIIQDAYPQTYAAWKDK